MMSTKTSTAHGHGEEMRERRGHFRICDDIALTYHVVDEKDYLEEWKKESNSRTNSFNIKAKFAALERSLRPVLTRLKERSEDLALYLETINDKLDMLADALFQSDNEKNSLPTRQVNISAGGISFEIQKPIKPGKLLKLRLLLPPDGIGIETYARVVYCREERPPGTDPFPYRVGVEFLNMCVEDSDLITRHVLCKEALLRRKKPPATKGTVTG